MFDFTDSELAIERDGENRLPLGVESSEVTARFDAGRMAEVICLELSLRSLRGERSSELGVC